MEEYQEANGAVNVDNLRGQHYKEFFSDRIVEGEFFMDDVSGSFLSEQLSNSNLGGSGSFSFSQPNQILSFEI